MSAESQNSRIREDSHCQAVALYTRSCIKKLASVEELFEKGHNNRETMEVVFSMQSMPSLHKKASWTRQKLCLMKANFLFRNTRNGTRVVMKEMAVFSHPSHFKSNNLPYFTFYFKSQKPLKTVIRHLPFLAPAEDTSYRLVNHVFDIISIKLLPPVNHLQKDQPQ
jgi:hypothetical protein